MLGMMTVIEVAIALMVVRVDSQHAAYAMGMTLPLFASAFLLVWSWRYTLALVVIGVLALVAATLTAPETPSTAALTTVAFYVGTASLLAFVAQLHRERLAWREFCSRAELEREQARNLELVDELARLSHEDPLTGLANRRAWDHALGREVEAAREPGHGPGAAAVGHRRLQGGQRRAGPRRRRRRAAGRRAVAARGRRPRPHRGAPGRRRVRRAVPRPGRRRRHGPGRPPVRSVRAHDRARPGRARGHLLDRDGRGPRPGVRGQRPDAACRRAALPRQALPRRRRPSATGAL